MKSYRAYLDRTSLYDLEIKLLNVLMTPTIESYIDWETENSLENTKYHIIDEVFLTDESMFNRRYH